MVGVYELLAFSSFRSGRRFDECFCLRLKNLLFGLYLCIFEPVSASGGTINITLSLSFISEVQLNSHRI